MTASAVLGRLRGLGLPLISVLIGLAAGAVAVLLSGTNPWDAYVALFQGAFTNAEAFTETLVATIPYVFLGLSVSVGFRAGLFNIGGAGQLFLGGSFAGFVGYAVTDLPGVLHLPLALLAGEGGGVLLGGSPRLLEAHLGAHRVIPPIMLNLIAAL